MTSLFGGSNMIIRTVLLFCASTVRIRRALRVELMTSRECQDPFTFLAHNQIDSVIVILDRDATILNQSKKRRAEPRRLARNQIESVIVILDHDATILNQSRKRRAEPRRLARNQMDTVIVILDRDDTILNLSRKRRAESKKRLARNQIDSLIVVDDTIGTGSR
jgi:hypothetical protein